MKKNTLKQKIGAGRVSVGTWMTLADEGIAEILSNAGFDWIVIDLEHSCISLDQMGRLIRIIELSDCSPFVRLTSNNPMQIKRVLDAGAHGIVVPMVESKEAALSAVQATRYPPYGNRSVGLARAQDYGRGFNEYWKWQETEITVVVQLESEVASENAKEILETPGVSGFIVGPYDLSASLGIPGDFENPKFLAALNRISDAAKIARVPSGIHIVEPNPILFRKAVSDGFSIIAYSVDTRFIETTVSASIDAIMSSK